jgi:thioredoxin 1
MENEEDEDLERIKRERLRGMRRRALGKQGKSASNTPIDVTDATFTETIQNNSLVVIDCWAPWCAPCFMIAPIIEEMAREYSGSITFGKLNIDENQKVTLQYQIMGIPTLLVFKEGRLVDRIIGAIPRQTLEPKITRHL